MEKNVHDNFIKYTEMIVNHPNYNGLEYTRDKNGKINWVTSTNSKLGKARKEWAQDKAREYDIQNQAGMYAKLMFNIHPTKYTVCQICGSSMSIKYIYPSKNFANKLAKKFDYVPSVMESIYDISDYLLKFKFNYNEEELKKYYFDSLKLDESLKDLTLAELIEEIEKSCRLGGKRILGPGAMSNFPDRFDGFHSYNKCCRSKEDKGRHSDNMRSYGKDRRAFENWSDGNIHAANQFMGSPYFKGASADHIGPISLGFIHDSRYLVKMSIGDNSSKRNKLLYEDIVELIKREKETNVQAMSWFGRIIWEKIKVDFYQCKLDNQLLETYQRLLLLNLQMYMEIMWLILDKAKLENKNYGREFLENNYLKSKKEYFRYDYEFDTDGNILNKKERNYTERTMQEYPRFVRISFESIEDYHNKNNRRLKYVLSNKIIGMVDQLIEQIIENPQNFNNIKLFENLIEENQRELLNISTMNN